MSARLALAPHRITQSWTLEQIDAAKTAPLFRPDDKHNPLLQLEDIPGWWRGKIFTRKQFAEQDRERAGRFAERSASNSPDAETPSEVRFAWPMLMRDHAFAAVAAAEKAHAIADQHERAIERYEKKLAGVAS